LASARYTHSMIVKIIFGISECLKMVSNKERSSSFLQMRAAKEMIRNYAN